MSPRNNRILFTSLLWLAAAPLAFSQMGPGMGSGMGRGGMDFHRPPMERAFHDGHFGRWWDEPRLAQQIGLTDDQKHRMDDIFQQHRLKLIDLNATLQKQEAIMQPLVEADQADETKILAQIDAVAQARAELEKANARMLFDLRKVLTPDQWKKLQAIRAEHRSMAMRGGDRRGMDGRGGSDGRGDHQPGRWHRDGGQPGAPAAPPAQGAAPATPSGEME